MTWLVVHEFGCSEPCTCGARDRAIMEEDEQAQQAQQARNKQRTPHPEDNKKEST